MSFPFSPVSEREKDKVDNKSSSGTLFSNSLIDWLLSKAVTSTTRNIDLSKSTQSIDRCERDAVEPKMSQALDVLENSKTPSACAKLKVSAPLVSNASSASTNDWTPIRLSSPKVSKKVNDERGSIADRVNKAVALGKVFTITGVFPFLRGLLTERGWVQKLTKKQMKELAQESATRAECALKNYNAIAVNKLLININSNFIWTQQNYKQRPKSSPYFSRLVGRPIECDFARKVGLLSIYNRLYWYELKSPFEFIYPRCYQLTSDEETRSFVEDFRLTYCTSFLYYLCKLDRMKAIFSRYGSATSDSIIFAIDQVKCAIAQKNHQDIILKGTSKVFLTHSQMFQSVMQNGVKIRIIDGRTPEDYVDQIRSTMKEALKYFPHIPRDGIHNLWIVKPVGFDSGCGYGIIVFNEEIRLLNYVKDGRYLVQKYIEYPLLIYNTKFDIRQYFMITMDSTNVNVWMYRNCYLKFSSQEFSLSNLSQAIHVTNHTVQKNYINGQRSPYLPPHNMWVLSEFQEYLRRSGHPDVWEAQLYPGMVHIIRTVINASLDEMEHAKNNFQLFGADFMITSDLKPILIEVNSSPDLSHSTVSTKKVCTAVVQDMLKVVLDHPNNSNCCTGDFQLVWSIDFLKSKHHNVNGLIVSGKSLKKKYFTQPVHRPEMVQDNRGTGFLERNIYFRSLNLIQQFEAENRKIKVRNLQPERKRLSSTSSASDTRRRWGRKPKEHNTFITDPFILAPRYSDSDFKLREVKHDLVKAALKGDVCHKRQRHIRPGQPSSPVDHGSPPKSKVLSEPFTPPTSTSYPRRSSTFNKISSKQDARSISKNNRSPGHPVLSITNLIKKNKPIKPQARNNKESATDHLYTHDRKLKESETVLSKCFIQNIQPFSIPIQELKASFQMR